MVRQETRAPWVWDELGTASSDTSVPEEVAPTLEEQLDEAYRRGLREGHARGRRDMEAELETAKAAQLLGHLPGPTARRITYAVSKTANVNPKNPHASGLCIRQL